MFHNHDIFQECRLFLYMLLTLLFTTTHDIDYAPHNRKNLSITMLMEI